MCFFIQLHSVIQVEANDVDASVVFTGNADTGSVVFKPSVREKSGSGSAVFPAKGTMTLVLDNSYSYFTSKSVHVMLAVMASK